MKEIIFNNDVIRKSLNNIEKQYKEEKISFRMALAQAMSLGMKQSEEKIKYGINIVFENLHK